IAPKGHGYPLSHPQPFDDFPRWEGIEIGDVGVLTFDGLFDVFFNIRRHDDPVNRFGLPEGIEAVQLDPADFAVSASYHSEGSHVSNKIIQKRRLGMDAGLDDNTAVLLLPNGASRIDLRFQHIFRDQALKHAKSWYTFLRGRGHMVENRDLYLITGVDSSTSWSLAAVDEHTEDNSISL
ncbi:hypothetical protein B0H11DRAFT_1658898, partial [Mycena galericulata]